MHISKLSKSNFILKFKHHWSAFNIYKEHLRKAVDKADEHLSQHDIDSLKISLRNMREQFEQVESYIGEYDRRHK